jgi:hypothetical protein
MIQNPLSATYAVCIGSVLRQLQLLQRVQLAIWRLTDTVTFKITTSILNFYLICHEIYFPTWYTPDRSLPVVDDPGR